MTPLPAPKVLETFFLEARCKILDLAGILDRIGRGQEASKTMADPRVAKIHAALEVLLDPSGSRAERVQQIFSLEYDAGWEKPMPRYS